MKKKHQKPHGPTFFKGKATIFGLGGEKLMEGEAEVEILKLGLTPEMRARVQALGDQKSFPA